MFTVVLNIATLFAFVLVAGWWLYSVRLYGRNGLSALTIKRYGLGVIVAGVLLAKFVQIGDEALIAGQALVLVVGLVLGGWMLLPTTRSRVDLRPKLKAAATLPGKKSGVSGKTRPRRKVMIASTIVVAAITAGVLWIALAFNGSSQGTLITTPESEPATKPVQRLTFRGKNFSFAYPGSFHETTASSPQAPIIENYTFVRPGTPSWKLAIEITSLPSRNLHDDGSYHFRAVNPNRFTFKNNAVNGNTIYIATDTASGSAYAKAAYFQQGDLLASVALSGGGANDTKAMESIYTAMLQSWRWR